MAPVGAGVCFTPVAGNSIAVLPRSVTTRNTAGAARTGRERVRSRATNSTITAVARRVERGLTAVRPVAVAVAITEVTAPCIIATTVAADARRRVRDARAASGVTPAAVVAVVAKIHFAAVVDLSVTIGERRQAAVEGAHRTDARGEPRVRASGTSVAADTAVLGSDVQVGLTAVLGSTVTVSAPALAAELTAPSNATRRAADARATDAASAAVLWA